MSYGEIHITSKMVDAGVDAFLASYPDTGCGDAIDREMVVNIFKAMTIEQLPPRHLAPNGVEDTPGAPAEVG